MCKNSKIILKETKFIGKKSVKEKNNNNMFFINLSAFEKIKR